jgi:predicted RNase H-like HicB family nuclease
MRMQKLHLHNLIEKEGDLYSAVCLELNVASQGKTIEEAKKNLQEAVELYLEDVLEAGDEQEFIPRPASMKERIKFFEGKNL